MRAALPHSSHFIHRPVPENRLAVDESNIDRTKVAAIVRHGAMIAQHEVAVRRYDNLSIRPLIGVSSRHVIFFESFSVDENFTGFNADPVAGQGNHSLDKTF